LCPCIALLHAATLRLLLWPKIIAAHMPVPLQDCLRALLAVLMNMTQNNPAGCAAVVAAGALEPAAAVLAQLVRGGHKIKGEWLAGPLAGWLALMPVAAGACFGWRCCQPFWAKLSASASAPLMVSPGTLPPM
jgi:hypothetical protein